MYSKGIGCGKNLSVHAVQALICWQAPDRDSCIIVQADALQASYMCGLRPRTQLDYSGCQAVAQYSFLLYLCLVLSDLLVQQVHVVFKIIKLWAVAYMTFTITILGKQTQTPSLAGYSRQRCMLLLCLQVWCCQALLATAIQSPWSSGLCDCVCC